MLPQTHMDI